MLRAGVNLEVPGHVQKNPAEEEHSGDRHDRLFADGGTVELDDPGGADMRRGRCGSGHGLHHIDGTKTVNH